MERLMERREHPRFQAKDGTLAFTFVTKNVGQIIDISMNGLTFSYVNVETKSTTQCSLSGKCDKLDIVFGESNFILKDVPIKIVSDYETGPLSFDNTVFMKRRRCVQFGDLTPDQIFQLKRFIFKNTKTDTQQFISFICSEPELQATGTE